MLLQDLGFIIHDTKSVLIPTQEIVYLGYIINSVSMTIRITKQKNQKNENLCIDLLSNRHPTIRQAASLLGNVVASMLAVPYGQMHYRHTEKCKIEALKTNFGNFESKMALTEESKSELNWWINNIHKSFESVLPIYIDYEIHTDASLLCWGATDGKNKIGGPWSLDEQTLHINALELLSVKLSLQTLCKNNCYKHYTY